MKKIIRLQVLFIALIAFSCGKEDGPPAVPVPDIDIYAFGQCTTQPGNNFDMRLKKYDAVGNEVANGWDLRLDDGNSDYGSNGCMGVDSEGNVYIAYWAFIAGTGDDWRIRKFAPSGTEAPGWDKRVGRDGSGRSGIPIALLVDSADDIYAIGITAFGGTDNEWQIKKYHSDGTEIAEGWDKVIGSPATSDYPIAAALGPDRSLYVLGLINGSRLVKKFSESGVEDASYVPSIAAGCYAAAIALDSAGCLFIAGSRDMGPATREDWFIKKFSATGIEITEGWDKTVDGEGHIDTFDCLMLGMDDSIYAAGSLLSVNATFSRERVVKYLPDGSTGWELTLDEGVFSKINSIAIGPDGEAYAFGYFKGSDDGLSQDWRILKLSRDGEPDPSGWNLTFDANSGQNSGQSIVAVF